jgi:thiaminase (transcriptional activator TenA)
LLFSDQLRSLADPLFTTVKSHPFVVGIADESLERAQLIHYVQQDFQYLNSYIHVYGLGISKCVSREDMRKFHDRIGFVLDDELHAHQNLCDVAGVDYRDLQKNCTLAPSAHHYAAHMVSVAQSGTLGDILAALLPCHWMYVEIADDIMKRVQPQPNHVFYPWISFYQSEEMKESLHELREWLDANADDVGPRAKERMEQAFMVSCQMECRFFDMAYNLEKWGGSDGATQ